MADVIKATAGSELLHTGKGQLVGMVISCETGVSLATFYDNTAGSGTIIFESYVSVGYPLIIFFSDPLAPRFATGLYSVLGANLTSTIWTRQL